MCNRNFKWTLMRGWESPNYNPWNPNLIKNKEDVRLTRKLIHSILIIFHHCASHFHRKTANELKHWCKNHIWSDKAFKSKVVNWTLSSLHGGLLDITRTVPLNTWLWNQLQDKFHGIRIFTKPVWIV